MRGCRSIQSGASGLPYYCAPLVCVSEVIESLAVWRHYKPKTKNPTPQFILGSFLRGGPKFCLQQSCSAMDLNKAVPLWGRKSWRERYSNTMRLGARGKRRTRNLRAPTGLDQSKGWTFQKKLKKIDQEFLCSQLIQFTTNWWSLHD